MTIGRDKKYALNEWQLQLSTDRRREVVDVPKILLAIPDREVRHLLKVKLSRERCHVLLADTGEQTCQVAGRERPAMAIVDTALPGLDGYEVCRRIRKDPGLDQTFVILIEEAGGQLGWRNGLERGPNDFILKPVHPEELVIRIMGLMRRNCSGNGHHGLTGLPGLDLAKKEIKRCLDWQQSVAICAINLDHFRAYNEVYGFEFGDRAIQHLGHVLAQAKSEVKPKYFFLSHIGADRFVAVISPNVAERYCRRVIEKFEQIRASFFTQGDRERNHLVAADRTGRMRRYALLTISIGVVCGESQPFGSSQEAMETALWAAQQAKMRWGNNLYLRRDGSAGLTADRGQKRHRKILVVDGDIISMRLLKSRLEREGYDVRTATSAPEAVKISRQDPPDIIFLDEDEADRGYQMVSSLKKDVQVASIPLVISTSREDYQRGQLMGADDCLARPYTFKHLMTKLEEYLDRH